MSAERWMKQLEMMEKVRQAVLAKEKVAEAEQERIRQQAEKRAWLRELGRADDDCHGLFIDEGDKNGN